MRMCSLSRSIMVSALVESLFMLSMAAKELIPVALASAVFGRRGSCKIV